MQTVRTMRTRFRVVRYLSATAVLWALVCVGTAAVAYRDQRFANAMLYAGSFALLLIMSVTFALSLALSRCAGCDKRLSRPEMKKLACPACGARLFEEKVGF